MGHPIMKPTRKTRTFRDGDVIRCYEKAVMRDWKSIDAHSCEYEKKEFRSMGLVHNLGTFERIDFRDVVGKNLSDKSDDVFLEFTPIKGCERTEHLCTMTTRDKGYGESLICSSKCLVS